MFLVAHWSLPQARSSRRRYLKRAGMPGQRGGDLAEARVGETQERHSLPGAGRAPKLQANTKRGGLFRVELPFLVFDSDFWCKATWSHDLLCFVGLLLGEREHPLDAPLAILAPCFDTGISRTDSQKSCTQYSILLRRRGSHQRVLERGSRHWQEQPTS
jgi:hypothetical protein